MTPYVDSWRRMKIPDAERRPASSPILGASAAVHVGAAAAALLLPHAWPWALGAVVANHGILTAAGLWPKSRLLGPNWTHLPFANAAKGEVGITIDDGPDPDVTPRVLELLAKHEAHATFFCIGQSVQHHPELAREIVRLGHAIENHSQHHHHNFSLLGPKAMLREISHAQDSILDVTGSLPRFFRAPAGLRNPFLEPVLNKLNLHLASWTRRGFDTVTTSPDTVYGRLVNSLNGGDILLLHDGHASRNAAGQPIILDVLPRLLVTLHTRQLFPVTLRATLA